MKDFIKQHFDMKSPTDLKQVLIIAQSCQRNAVVLVKTRYLINKVKDVDITKKKLLHDVRHVTEDLFKQLVEDYTEQ